MVDQTWRIITNYEELNRVTDMPSSKFIRAELDVMHDPNFTFKVTNQEIQNNYATMEVVY